MYSFKRNRLNSLTEKSENTSLGKQNQFTISEIIDQFTASVCTGNKTTPVPGPTLQQKTAGKRTFPDRRSFPQKQQKDDIKQQRERVQSGEGHHEKEAFPAYVDPSYAHWRWWSWSCSFLRLLGPKKRNITNNQKQKGRNKNGKNKVTPVRRYWRIESDRANCIWWFRGYFMKHTNYNDSRKRALMWNSFRIISPAPVTVFSADFISRSAIPG